MGYCSNCGNWVDEGSTCSHCGSGGGGHDPEDYWQDLEDFKDTLNSDGNYDPDDYIAYTPEGERLIKAITNRDKGDACSKKGDHLNAIKYYKKSLKATQGGENQASRLSCLAREYEAIGDYVSAEVCWERCLDTARHVMYNDLYLYIAKKADFLYRRERYNKALDSYEEALRELDSKVDNNITLFQLRYYARVTHYIIDSYEKLGEDNHKKKYHHRLKDAIGRYIRSQKKDDKTIADYISRTGWEVFRDYRLADEALIFVDSAIEFHPDCSANDYNRKAILLEYKFRYEEALKYYDKALSMDKSNETTLKNRAKCEAECIKSKLEMELLFRRIKPHHLELINKALKILPNEYDNSPYLDVKANVLDQLDEPVKAWICRSLTGKDYETVDKVEKQLKEMKTGGTYINITGIHYYKGFEPFKEGVIVDLIREPGNPHYKDAIMVVLDGETVGYVANGRHTAIKEVKSATDLKDIDFSQAEVQFILFRKWVIAKLI